MKAESKVYIQLQSIYKAKARQDAAEVLQIAQAAPGGDLIDPAEVDLFCKNAAFVKLINATRGAATAGTGSSTTDVKISKADRLKSAAGKHLHPPPLFYPHHNTRSPASDGLDALRGQVICMWLSSPPSLISLHFSHFAEHGEKGGEAKRSEKASETKRKERKGQGRELGEKRKTMSEKNEC